MLDIVKKELNDFLITCQSLDKDERFAYWKKYCDIIKSNHLENELCYSTDAEDDALIWVNESTALLYRICVGGYFYNEPEGIKNNEPFLVIEPFYNCEKEERFPIIGNPLSWGWHGNAGNILTQQEALKLRGLA